MSKQNQTLSIGFFVLQTHSGAQRGLCAVDAEIPGNEALVLLKHICISFEYKCRQMCLQHCPIEGWDWSEIEISTSCGEVG